MNFSLITPKNADSEVKKVLESVLKELNSGTRNILILPMGYTIKEGG